MKRGIDSYKKRVTKSDESKRKSAEGSADLVRCSDPGAERAHATERNDLPEVVW